MKYIILGLIFGFCLFLNIVPAKAAKNYMTGRELQRYCTSSFNTDYGYCTGFITGIADILLTAPVEGIEACHKTSVKSQQLVDIVLLYIKSNPKTTRQIARKVVANALSEAFPCMKL